VRIERAILFLRGHKVMLDSDLAELYGSRPRFSTARSSETWNDFLPISCSN